MAMVVKEDIGGGSGSTVSYGTVTTSSSIVDKDYGDSSVTIGSITWSFTYQEFLNALTYVKGNGIYYRLVIGGSQYQLLNSGDNAINCSISGSGAGSTTTTRTYGGSRNGTAYYSVTNSGFSYSVSGIRSTFSTSGGIVWGGSAGTSTTNHGGSWTLSNIWFNPNSLPVGYHSVYIEIYSVIDGIVSIFKREYIGILRIVGEELYEISLGNLDNVKKNFYLQGQSGYGESFNHNNLQVNAKYRKGIAKTYTNTYNNVSGFSVTAPDMTTVGNGKDVIVTYGGVSTSYKINVVGVSSFTKPTCTSPVKLGTAQPSLTTTITYSDGSTSTDSVTISGYTTDSSGSKSITYSAVASKTGQTQIQGGSSISWTSTLVVCSYYMDLNTDNVTKNYNYNDTISIVGLVYYRKYLNPSTGSEEISLRETISDLSGVTAEVNSWEVGNNSGTIIVSETASGLSASYSVNVNGLYDIKLDTDNLSLRNKVNTPFSFSGLKVYVKRYSNGTLDANWSEYTGLITKSPSTITISEAKTTTVTCSISENGITLSDSFDVTYYTYTSLVITNAPTSAYKIDGSLPVLSLPSGFEVEGVCSDGQSNEKLVLNSSYSISPATGTSLSLGNNTITITATTVGTSDTFDIVVEEDHPLENATISVSGSLTKSKYLIGDTVDLSGISVTVSEMASGRKNYPIQYSAVLSGLNRLNFQSGDTIGNYDLVISVSGVTNTYTIDDAVLLKGISSVTNVAISKTKFKAGEKVTADMISGTINFNDNTTDSVRSSDITELRTTAFTAAEAGTVTLTFKVCGFTKTLNVTVIKISSISMSLSKTIYNWGDSFEKNTASLEVTYSDGTTKINPSYNDATFTANAGTLSGTLTFLKPYNMTTANNTCAITVSYTEEGVTVTNSVNVVVKTILDVVLYDENNDPVSYFKNTLGTTLTGKIAFDNGDTIALPNYKITILYNTNQVIQINDIDLIYDGENIIGKVSSGTTSKTATYTASCGTVSGQIQSIAISVVFHNHYLSDIAVDFTSITGVTQFAYDSLDLTGITATKTVASTDSDDTSYPSTESLDLDDISFTFNGQNISTTGFTLPVAGTYNLVAIYEENGIEIRKTQSVTVVATTLQSISFTKAETYKELNTYVEEQNLNLTGLTINLVYNRSASNHSLSWNEPNIRLLDSDGETFSKSKELDLVDNNTELFISYTENNVTKTLSLGTLSVAAKALASISVQQAPTMVAYTYGDAFSLSGLILKATFNSGKSEVISLLDDDLTITGITIPHTFNPTDDTTFGNKTITFSYEYNGVTKTCTQTIELVKPQIDHLNTNANDVGTPVVTSFVNLSVFSMSGLVVTAVMKNGWTVVLATYTNNATTVLNLDNDSKIQCTGNYGNKTITLSGANPYDSLDTATCTYDVEVTTNGAIVSAFLKLTGDYKSYVVGDTFTAKGVAFHVTDIDGNDWDATNIVTDPAIGTQLRSASRIDVKVTYVKGTFSKTETYQIIVSVANKIQLTEENTYQIAIGRANGTLFTSIEHEEATIQLGVIDLKGNTYYPVFHEDKVSIDDNPLHTDTYGMNVYTGSDEEGDCIGYMDMGIDQVRNAHLVLFDDPLNPIDGDGNIVVTFPHYVSGHADRINYCSFGVVFNKRLFVSGNDDFKNCDWHSGAINIGQVENYNQDSNKDYTYFSDLDYCYYGNSETAIVGYDIYRDGDLIVVKEGSRNQATLYKRSLKYVTATSYDGSGVTEDNDLVEESFPMFDINANGGEGGISNMSIVNFVGETIILTRTGLKALTSKDDVYNNAKYTYDVSSYINPKIVYEDLENAILFSFKQKLILKTNRGVYVGYYELRNDNDEYEWYFLDNIDANIFFELDDELYFANDKGEINRFPKELIEYKDKPRTFIGTGGTMLSIDEQANTIIASADYKDNVVEGAPFHLLTTYTVGGADVKSQIHASMGKFINKNTRQNAITTGAVGFDQTIYSGIIDTDDNTIEVKPYTSTGAIDIAKQNDIKVLYYDGREIYLDLLTGAGIQTSIDTKYHLVKVSEDINNHKYYIYDEYDNKMNLLGIETMRMSFIVNDIAITHITQITPYGTSGAKQFKLLGDHDKILDLIYYNNRNDRYSGVITNEEKINSYFVTAPYTMGSLVSYKTVWSWVIANDTNLSSYMDVGQLSSRKQGGFDMVVKSVPDSRSFSFSGFAFDKVQFTSDKLPHIYTKFKTLPNVGFIRFVFKNDQESNMVLTTLQLVYTISQLTKGVN